MIELYATELPFGENWLHASCEPNQTIRELVGPDVPIRAWIDGREVDEEEIKNGVVGEGTVVRVRVEAGEPISFAAMSAYFASAAVGAGLSVGAAAAVGTIAATVASVAITAGISYGLQMVSGMLQSAGPGRSAGGTDRVHSITGQSNQVAPYEPIPRLFGRMRYFPPIPMSALPYTESAGDDQYLRMMLCLNGGGPIQIGSITVGEIVPYVAPVTLPVAAWTVDQGSLGSGTVYGQAGIYGSAYGGSTTAHQDIVLPSSRYGLIDDGHALVALDYQGVVASFNVFPPKTGAFVTVSYAGTNGVFVASHERPITLVHGQYIAQSQVYGVPAGSRKVRLALNLPYYGAPSTSPPVIYLTPISAIIESNGGLLTQDSYLETVLDQPPIQIGGTDIHEYDDVQFEIGRPEQITLYKDQVIETNPAWKTGEGQDGQTATRTLAPGAEEFSVDLDGSVWSADGKNGDTAYDYVPYTISWRKTGSSDAWQSKGVVFGFTADHGGRGLAGSHARTSWSVPGLDTSVTYDVMLTRNTTIHGRNSNRVSDITWTALRAFTPRRAFAVDNTVVMAIRIKATDQLQGTLQQVSVLATAMVNVWNGTAWSLEPSRTPAWAFASVWTDSANKRPIDPAQLNADELLAWANESNAAGRYYDAVLDNNATTLQRVQEISTAGRASWNIEGDTRVSIVRDVNQDTPAMVISPRNSYGYKYTLKIFDPPNALRVQYVDTKTWQTTDRIVYDDGFDETNAVVYETIAAPGCTDPEQAWKNGRYELAVRRLRVIEQHEFGQDVQQYVYKRGDRLALSQDVILVGLAYGRIKSTTGDGSGHVTGIEVDEFLPMPDASKTYGVQIQREDASVITVGVVTNAPGSNTVTFDTPQTGVNPGDHVVFGEAGKITTDIKVTAMQSGPDHQVSVVCVPYAPDVLLAETGLIPAPPDDITHRVNQAMLPPPAPVITAVLSDNDSAVPDSDGRIVPQATVRYSTAGYTGLPGTQIESQIRTSISWITGPTVNAGAGQVVFKNGLTTGDIVDLRIRAARNGIVSAWATQFEYTILTVQRPPTVDLGTDQVINKDASNIHYSGAGLPLADADVLTVTAIHITDGGGRRLLSSVAGNDYLATDDGGVIVTDTGTWIQVGSSSGDYTLAGASVQFALTPALASILDWDGTYTGGVAVAQQFGTGDGTTNHFTLKSGTATSVQSLMPAQAGADITGENTALRILLQGDLATLDQVNFSTQISDAAPPMGYLTTETGAVLITDTGAPIQYTFPAYARVLASALKDGFPELLGIVNSMSDQPPFQIIDGLVVMKDVYAGLLMANTVLAGTIAAGAVTVEGGLSALTANLGVVTAGVLRQGLTSYSDSTHSGFYLGPNDQNGNLPSFRVGTPTGYLGFDGQNLSLFGQFTTTGGSAGSTVTIGGQLSNFESVARGGAARAGYFSCTTGFEGVYSEGHDVGIIGAATYLGGAGVWGHSPGGVNTSSGSVGAGLFGSSEGVGGVGIQATEPAGGNVGAALLISPGPGYTLVPSHYMPGGSVVARGSSDGTVQLWVQVSPGSGNNWKTLRYN